jgi:hypothetical protein
VVLSSAGTFAGSTQSAALGDGYDVTRTGEGWSTSPFTEPAGFFNHEAEVLLDGSSDSRSGLFIYNLVPPPLGEGESNLYVRALPSGGPVEVGPVFPKPVLEANPNRVAESTPVPSASNDLSSVVFFIKGPGVVNPAARTSYLWPGDGTVENAGPLYSEQGFMSLYEYRGTGNLTPTLVGVDENRQISQCGVVLGFPAKGVFAALSADEVYNAISGDGSRVFFTAAAATQGPSENACTGAGAGRGPHVNELWARTDGSMSTAISEPSKMDCAACNTSESVQRGAVFQGASEDGSKVFFLSEQQLLPGAKAKGNNLYEYDFDAEEGRRVTLVAPEVLGVSRVSEDGSHVYFVCEDALTGANRGGKAPTAGAPNLYVYASGHTAFVGMLLAETDAQDWSQEDARPVDATRDGRFLVFTSSAPLTAGDTSSVAQAFEYDAANETLVRVSVGQGGFNNDGNTSVFPASIASPRYSERQNPAPQLTSVSNDGSVVVFQSSDALTPQAAVGYPSVYEYRAGQVSLISDGQVGSNTSLIGMDGSGADVFFGTTDQLVAQDGDTQMDVYDARIGGGFPAPAPPPACQGEGCRGGLASVPLFSSPASVGQPAGEQVMEPQALPVVKKSKTKKSRATHKRRRGRGRRVARRTGGIRHGAGSAVQGRGRHR